MIEVRLSVFRFFGQSVNRSTGQSVYRSIGLSDRDLSMPGASL